MIGSVALQTAASSAVAELKTFAPLCMASDINTLSVADIRCECPLSTAVKAAGGDRAGRKAVAPPLRRGKPILRCSNASE